jgi:hypothetical protein
MNGAPIFDLIEVGFQDWRLGLIFLVGIPMGMLLLKFQDRIGYRLAEWLPILPKMVKWHPLCPKDDRNASVFFIKTMGYGSVLAALVGPLMIALAFYLPYQSLLSAYNSGQYEVVQGTVDGFVPTEWCVQSARGSNSLNEQPSHNYPVEQFRVGETVFVYSDYLITGGFHQTYACGGPIRDGQLLKIWHVAGVIIRIEPAEA